MKPILCGIDRIEADPKILKNQKVGLITNHTGVSRELDSTIDILKESGNLVCLFAPEHGVRGELQAGAAVSDSVDRNSGVKVYSLYGKNRKPTEAMLRDVDALVYDIQDVGARYYTYLSTMACGMEAAKNAKKKFMVLDRPNPLGGVKTEGDILNSEFSSFIGRYPIPARYGLTTGELAGLINCEFGVGCDLEVVKMDGWKRDMYFEETGLDFLPPSPNIPTRDTALAYIGTCLFEGTNVSEGRGTTQPFLMIGAPWMNGIQTARELNHLNLPGVKFCPCYFTPTFSKYEGEHCEGIRIQIRDKYRIPSFRMGVAILCILHENDEEFSFLPPYKAGGTAPFDLLAGTKELKAAIQNGGVNSFLEDADSHLAGFEKIRQKYFLY